MLMLLSTVLAQGFTDGAVPDMNAQLFRPSIDSLTTLWTDQSLMAADSHTMARAMLHYVNDPVVYLGEDGERTELVGGVTQLNLTAAHSRDRLRLGVDLPLFLRSNGTLGGETGLGDIGLEARYTLLDRRGGGLGVAPIVRINLPTTTIDAPVGSGGFGYEVGMILDKELGDNTVLAVNVGTKGVPEVQLENVQWGDQLFLRGGIGHALSEDAGLHIDVASHLRYGEFSNPAARPTEGLLGGWARVGDSVVVRGAIGTGLNGGIGAPKYRVVLGLGWEPVVEGDRDRDGLLDGSDACVDVPEDLDGYQDDDGCPDATPVTIRVVNKNGDSVDGATWTVGEATGASGDSVELEAGPVGVTASHVDYRPASKEAKVKAGGPQTITIRMDLIPGTLMVMAVDSDGNAVEDAIWRAHGTDITRVPAGESYELDHGDYVIVVTAAGYRPIKQKVTIEKETEARVELSLEPSKAKITEQRVELEEKVFFEVNEAIIKGESFGLLDDVAAILDAHPELTRIRIEGHTDSDGPDDANMDLSQRRAQAVVDYLTGKGIDPARLEASGYGETKPLVPNSNPANKAKNRRVELHVAERSSGPTLEQPKGGKTTP